MASKGFNFLCPKCKERTTSAVVDDPLNQNKGGFCHLKGENCRHIVLLKCDECGTDHAVESSWKTRW